MELLERVDGLVPHRSGSFRASTWANSSRRRACDPAEYPGIRAAQVTRGTRCYAGLDGDSTSWSAAIHVSPSRLCTGFGAERREYSERDLQADELQRGATGHAPSWMWNEQRWTRLFAPGSNLGHVGPFLGSLTLFF